MMRLDRKGFTLIEVIVVAAIIAILAGILVPMILKEIDESRITRAAGDIRSISSAIIVLKKDTGQWPVSATCTPNVTLLVGVGSVPDPAAGVIGWDFTTQAKYDDYFLNDAQECWPDTWKGPYMASVTIDPWGHSYITNASNFLVQGTAAWLLSAGPNGVIDTPADNNIVAGDDIGMRLK